LKKADVHVFSATAWKVCPPAFAYEECVAREQFAVEQEAYAVRCMAGRVHDFDGNGPQDDYVSVDYADVLVYVREFVGNDFRVESGFEFFVSRRVVMVTVSVDDVFQVEILVFEDENYCVDVEARINDCRFTGSIVCNNVREVVASILDLLEKHENQRSKLFFAS
jgi:hypothetical protein